MPTRLRIVMTAALLATAVVGGTACQGTPVADCTPSLDVCNGLDDDCDGVADDGFDVGEACSVGLGACRTEGHLACAPSGASVVCDVVAGAPSSELCNEVDDDCDGFVDEQLTGCCTPGATRPCGAAADVGVCRAGTETCTAAYGWPGTCLDGDGAPATLPGVLAERCNGLDDDCDGTVDEGFNVGQHCTAGTGACFAEGSMACLPDGSAAACTAQPAGPATETCNTLDDDCDGVVDEGFGAGEACSVGQGACRAEGHLACAPSGASVVCDAVEGTPAAEICNGLDDDCDGLEDELLTDCCTPGTTRSCGAAAEVGVCHGGTETCSAGHVWPGECLDAGGAPVILPGAQPELCNGLDDDCDGSVDEGFDDPSDVDGWCSAGLGQCRRWALRLCSADGTASVCPAVAAPPGVETCNGYDDDCDGETDEHSVLDMCGTVPPANHSQPEVVSCTDRRCVLTCDAGWYDEDAVVTNGCECQPDEDDLAGRANECNAPFDLGTIVPGQSLIQHTGTVVPATDADFFRVRTGFSNAGTDPWPTDPTKFAWWVCMRLDPAYATEADLSITGSGSDPVPICDPGWGGDGGCFNNMNGSQTWINLRVDRRWSVPAACLPDAVNDTWYYRVQIKAYAGRPAWNDPW